MSLSPAHACTPTFHYTEQNMFSLENLRVCVSPFSCLSLALGVCVSGGHPYLYRTQKAHVCGSPTLQSPTLQLCERCRLVHWFSSLHCGSSAATRTHTAPLAPVCVYNPVILHLWHLCVYMKYAQSASPAHETQIRIRSLSSPRMRLKFAFSE